VHCARRQPGVPRARDVPPLQGLLPVGAPVTLAAEGRDAFLLWGHQH